MRFRQGRATRGSQKWVQLLVNENPRLLTDAVRAAAKLSKDWMVRWVSPLMSDDWAEYRDMDFLAAMGLGRLADDLEKFWPEGGPQWDALGRSNDGGAVLVEAKSHTGELASSCGATEDSLRMIERSLDATRVALGAEPTADWLNGFYQYANRLAHLYFFQHSRVPARLVFLYFVNDAEMGGPTSAGQWKTFLESAYRHLGLRAALLPHGVVDVFIDVSTLP